MKIGPYDFQKKRKKKKGPYENLQGRLDDSSVATISKARLVEAVLSKMNY